MTDGIRELDVIAAEFRAALQEVRRTSGAREKGERALVEAQKQAEARAYALKLELDCAAQGLSVEQYHDQWMSGNLLTIAMDQKAIEKG